MLTTALGTGDTAMKREKSPAHMELSPVEKQITK